MVLVHTSAFGFSDKDYDKESLQISMIESHLKYDIISTGSH